MGWKGSTRFAAVKTISVNGLGRNVLSINQCLLMEKNDNKWLTTDEMMALLMSEPDREMEFTVCLGGLLRSTHWCRFISATAEFSDASDWGDDTLYTADEFRECLGGRWWRRD